MLHLCTRSLHLTLLVYWFLFSAVRDPSPLPSLACLSPRAPVLCPPASRERASRTALASTRGAPPPPFVSSPPARRSPRLRSSDRAPHPPGRGALAPAKQPAPDDVEKEAEL